MALFLMSKYSGHTQNWGLLGRFLEEVSMEGMRYSTPQLNHYPNHVSSQSAFQQVFFFVYETMASSRKHVTKVRKPGVGQETRHQHNAKLSLVPGL
jgi:hypothetical protein